MATEKYQIIFEGKIQDGQDLETVKSKLAKLFKSDVDQITKLFSGQRLVIKDNLDMDVAKKYCEVIKQQGAQCELKPKVAPTEQQSPFQQQTPSGITQRPDTTPASYEQVQEPEQAVHHNVNTAASQEENPLMTANTRSDSHSAQESQDLHYWHKGIDNFNTGELSDTSIAPVGIQLVDSVNVPDANIETQHLSMAAAGEQIVPPVHIDEPDIDIGNLSLEDQSDSK